MNKNEAIQLFIEIQNGRGVFDYFDEFPYKGEFADCGWSPEFSLGCEYGMLITLRIIYQITDKDLRKAYD